MVKVLLSIGFTLILNTTLLSQINEQQPLTTGPSLLKNPQSTLLSQFFSSDNFKMHHQYSFSMMAADGIQPMSQGEYVNSMLYQFDSFNGLLRMDIGVSHDPLGQKISTPGTNTANLYLKNLSLEFQPAQNMNIYIGVQQVPYSNWLFHSNQGYLSPLRRFPADRIPDF